MSWLVVLSCLGAGCRPTVGPRMRIAEFAGAHELRCTTATAADVTQLTENAFEVRGCGRIVELTDTDPGSGRQWELIRPAASRAVDELGCALEDIEPAGPQWPVQRTFVGCGSQITYRLACRPEGCTWVATAPGAMPLGGGT